MNPLISLVSGTYNRLEMLRTMVDSFRKYLLKGIEYEIVIVDGGSTDGTIEWCKQQPDIRLIEDGALLGAISAFTRGGFAAKGKYVLLANDDITFRPRSIMPAIVHLENNMHCGGVAFKDNRPVGSYTRKDYKVLLMEGNLNGVRKSIPYAQVGLFRGWIGNRLHWWMGEHDEMKGAQVYAGDNSLSAQIWHLGYTIDDVPLCEVEDHIANDELRQINYAKGIKANDSHFFYDQWPQGVIINATPQTPQQDQRAARILYMPIYEPGWEWIQKHPVHGKRGLRDALARGKNKFGVNHIVQEFDYLANNGDLRSEVIRIAEDFKPDLVITQIQSPQPLNSQILKDIRAISGATIINWNGDQSPGGLGVGSQEMLNLLHNVDLQLITNMDAAPVYDREGIKYDYWQIGYEEVDGNHDESKLARMLDDLFSQLGNGRSNPFKPDDQFTVVYLASLRSPERNAIADIVRGFGGVVSSPTDQYLTLYNFTSTKWIYSHAKVIISDNGFQSPGFVSNRLFQALAAGGGVVLQQHVDRLDELTGLEAGVHYLEWKTLDDLGGLINAALDPKYEDYRKQICTAGTDFVRANFSFDAQVTKLMQIIKVKLGKSEALKDSVELRFKGASSTGFGLGNMFPSGTRYEYEPGKSLFVRSIDADTIIQLYPSHFERVNHE